MSSIHTYTFYTIVVKRYSNCNFFERGESYIYLSCWIVTLASNNWHQYYQSSINQDLSSFCLVYNIIINALVADLVDSRQTYSLFLWNILALDRLSMNMTVALFLSEIFSFHLTICVFRTHLVVSQLPLVRSYLHSALASKFQKILLEFPYFLLFINYLNHVSNWQLFW